MLENKWSKSEESMTNYLPLPYSYNSDYQAQSNEPSSNSETSSQSAVPVSPRAQQGLMSISQPETPRPDATTPPIENLSLSPKESSATKPKNYTTTTFYSNPYSASGPIRRRKTEPVFSFDMGPAFSETKQLYELYSMDQTNVYKIQLHARIDRGFFRADQDWTCYRRNYFQVSSTFDVHGVYQLIKEPEVPCLLKKPDTQELVQVEYFTIGITARVTNNDKKIDLVQHTPKRDKGPQMIPEARPVRAGGNLHLSMVGSNNNIVTFERLQFKTATANNGKRRAAQQYYEVVVNLYANFVGRPPLCVATTNSAPLVVRGRSPGHYADSHTRFKHTDSESKKSNNNSKSMGSALTINSKDYTPSNHKFSNSMPNSPISELGPYSSYNPYPYTPIAAFSSSHMPSPSTQNASNLYHSSGTTSQFTGPYFQNVPPIYHSTPNLNMHPYNNSHLYMNDSYSNRSNSENNDIAYHDLDAGRS